MPDRQSIWQNELLTVSEVATYLRVTRVTVWRWCQAGKIPATRIGRNWRIHRDDLRRFLETSVVQDPDQTHHNSNSNNGKDVDKPMTVVSSEKEELVSDTTAKPDNRTDPEGTHD